MQTIQTSVEAVMCHGVTDRLNTFRKGERVRLDRLQFLYDGRVRATVSKARAKMTVPLSALLISGNKPTDNNQQTN